MLVRLTDLEADHAATFLVWAAESAHEMSRSADADEAAEGALMLGTALRVLAQVTDDDDALLDEPPKPGEPFDWDSFHAGGEAEDAEDQTVGLLDSSPPSA